jgi:hypothetical protein
VPRVADKVVLVEAAVVAGEARVALAADPVVAAAAAARSVATVFRATWGRFYETVSAEIYRQNLLWSNYSL